jgi:hypothetical protein
LIWELWPRCHVFVDTRQNLTDEMWPIFLDSQRAHTRPAAMETAFRRWHVELAVFRGPTFPSIVAPSDWQLVYKAGEQELYQHRAGRHARQNLERARAWLSRQTGAAIGEDQQARVAVEVGAQRWLSASNQRRARAQAARLQQSAASRELADGLALEGQLLFDAGLYQAALPLLRRVLTLRADQTPSLYRYALASFAVGDHAGARLALSRLATRIDELTSAQRGRLAVLARALSSR